MQTTSDCDNLLLTKAATGGLCDRFHSQTDSNLQQTHQTVGEYTFFPSDRRMAGVIDQSQGLCFGVKKGTVDTYVDNVVTGLCL